MAKRIFATLLTVIVVGVAWASVLNQGSCVQVSSETGHFESSYTFSVQNGYYPANHTVYVSIQPSVREYYAGKSQTVINEMDYVKFVTPAAVQSMADNIREITNATPYSDEEFANAVLLLVRDIPYVKNNAQYPVETLVDNQADCDGLSILAASLMKAGGLDVVLLLYNDISPPHMNIGVNLKQMPVSHFWWTVPSGIEYNNKTYWVAECTSLADWTVGDRPELLARNKPIVIPLSNCERDTPAKVSSSLDNPLLSSSVSMNLAAVYSNISGTRVINVSGSVLPAIQYETVTLYVNQPGYAPTAYETTTDEFGNYTLCWNTTLPGTYILKAGWSGFSGRSGSDSESVTVFVGAEQPSIDELSSDLLNGVASNALSQTYSPWYMSLVSQGSRELFKSNLNGTTVVLSGDFMVLSDGHELTPNDTTFTIPAHKEVYRVPRSQRTVTVLVPDQVITIPGIELLNSQFGFILLQNEAYNYTASVKVLNDNDLSQIVQNGTVFINASDIVTKNTWNKAIAKVSGTEAKLEVYDDNGRLLDNMSKTITSQNLGELGVLMTYPTGQIIAFKNVKVEAQSQSLPPLTQSVSQGNGFEFLYPYVRMFLLLAGTVLAVVCLKGRRDNKKNSEAIKEQY
jgi:hypothetical protein